MVFDFEYFGKYGLWLKQAARGEDTDLVDLSALPELPPKSIGHSYTLEKNINHLTSIKAWIRLLSEMVAVRLRKLLLEASVVHLYLRGGNLQWWSKQKKFPQATSDGQLIYQRCLLILKQLLPDQGISVRALGVSVSGLAPANHIYLFSEDQKRQHLIKALDRINQRFGEQTIYPAQVSILD